MTADRVFARAPEAPFASLERSLIDEFLCDRGCDRDRLRRLSPERALELLRRASAYASGRLSEVESRARYLHDVHR